MQGVIVCALSMSLPVLSLIIIVVDNFDQISQENLRYN